jgi:DNA-binding MarR family transcriptional regulator
MNLYKIAIHYRASIHFRSDLLPDVPKASVPWLILLDVFIAHVRKRRLCVTDVSFLTGLPSTTSLRWLEVLEGEGFISRMPDSKDKRRWFLEMTDAGVKLTSTMLEDLGKQMKAAMSAPEDYDIS